MIVWIFLLLLSALAGFLCACFHSGKFGLFLAGAVPWFGLLAWQLYLEYFAPYQGGGASMWLVAQIFAGTMAAATGIAAYSAGKAVLKRYS